jgi:hypothetical protein
MMFFMGSIRQLRGEHILHLFDRWTADWHQQPDLSKMTDPFEAAIEGLHRANFELWHQEDKARDRRARDAAIAAAKRAIDTINQRRNDQMESCDALLLEELSAEKLPNSQAELHSETPGLMLDRLSILSLKRYHTQEETERIPSPPAHRERNLRRLAILESQRNDLAACIDRLWRRVLSGEVRFQVYRQLKMYNDPDLNPVLYDRSAP